MISSLQIKLLFTSTVIDSDNYLHIKLTTDRLVNQSGSNLKNRGIRRLWVLHCLATRIIKPTLSAFGIEWPCIFSYSVSFLQ